MWRHRRPSAGDAPHEGPLKRKADINRVCVKASPAFGRRRLHRKTRTILIVLHLVWPNLVLAKLGLGQTWSGQTWSWPNLVLAKLGLAKLGLGQTWSGQTHSWPNLDLAKLGLARFHPLGPQRQDARSAVAGQLRGSKALVLTPVKSSKPNPSIRTTRTQSLPWSP